MADEIDRANDYTQVLTDAAVAFRKPEGPKATGFCLNCEEAVEEGRRFCNFDCMTDWEKRNGK